MVGPCFCQIETLHNITQDSRAYSLKSTAHCKGSKRNQMSKISINWVAGNLMLTLMVCLVNCLNSCLPRHEGQLLPSPRPTVHHSACRVTGLQSMDERMLSFAWAVFHILFGLNADPDPDPSCAIFCISTIFFSNSHLFIFYTYK
jgi:hypothetical protein